MPEPEPLGLGLEMRAGISDGDETLRRLRFARRLPHAIKEIGHENIRLERAAGFRRNDRQRLLEIASIRRGLDLRRIGAVEHVEAGKALLRAESFGQNLRAETGASHAEQHNIRIAALANL